MSDDNRWPQWVYGEGNEPDYRFSFANERTFLACIRTALALLASGVALDVVELSVGDGVQRVLAMLLVTLGLACAVVSWLRWARSEKAMRAAKPLPGFGFGAVFTLCVAIGTAVLIVSGM